MYLGKDLIRLDLWDTAGQEKFHALGPIYYRGANGALLVYDVTNPESFDRVVEWTKELNKMEGTGKIQLSIIGNKLDLLSPVEQRSTQTNSLIQKAVKFAHDTVNARHYLTSAKLNQGIGDLFVDLSRRIIEQQKKTLGRENRHSMARSRMNAGAISVTDDGIDGDRDDIRNLRASPSLRLGQGNESELESKSCHC